MTVKVRFTDLLDTLDENQKHADQTAEDWPSSRVNQLRDALAEVLRTSGISTEQAEELSSSLHAALTHIAENAATTARECGSARHVLESARRAIRRQSENQTGFRFD